MRNHSLTLQVEINRISVFSIIDFGNPNVAV